MSGDALDLAFRSTLERQRERNARRLFAIRAVAIPAWFLGHAVFGLSGIRPDLVGSLGFLSVYAVASIALWLGGRRSRALLRQAWATIALLDVPMIVIAQYTILHSAPSAGAVAGFTLAILLIAVIAAQLWLDRTSVIGVGLAAAAGGATFMALGGLDLSTWVLSFLLAGVGVTLATAVVSQIVELVGGVARDQVVRQRLGRYLSPAIREQVIERGDRETEGKLVEITVLFADLRGFTSKAEAMEATEVVKLLNEFHTAMVGVIFEHGGTLDKFLGDGLMAWFGAPVPTEDHARAGVRCALAMLDALDELNARRRARGDRELSIGVGMNSGTAVVGDIGTDERSEYTAVGDAVNLASRLEGQTKVLGTPVVVSDATRRLAGEEFVWEEGARVTVKGKVEPIKTWRVARPGQAPRCFATEG